MSALTVTILNAEQGELSPEFSVLSIDVCKEFNRISYAELLIADGSIAQKEFTLANTGFFELGQTIVISASADKDPQQTQQIFSGLVVAQSVVYKRSRSLLSVRLKDVAVKMTRNRHTLVHRDLSDADIIASFAEKYGLQVGEVDATTPVHQELFQYYSSDWDFMLSRAKAQGLWLVSDAGELAARRFNAEGEAAHHIQYGVNSVSAFSMEVNAEAQAISLQGQSWDYAQQSLSEPVDAEDLDLPQGQSSAQELAGFIDNTPSALINPVALNQEELQAWANASLTQQRMAMRRGSISVPGMGNIKPFDVVELSGISDHFNGKVVVSAVRHRVAFNRGWTTDIQFGLSAKHMSMQADIADQPAASLVPPVNGLCMGLVADFEDDPDGEFRLKVILAGASGEDEHIWARLATPDAGSGRGIFFRPETGDEVVVGFFNDDPRQAVVLGALHSSAQPPFDEWGAPDEDNSIKGIVTKTGTKIEFVDGETGALSIQTQNENRILIDDSSESIEISDQHQNSIVLSSEGVVINSAADLKIAAAGNIEISGSQVDIN